MSFYCGQCGKLTRVKVEDNSIGLTGAYGTEIKHTDKTIVSKCCGADIFTDKALSTLAVFENITGLKGGRRLP